MQAPLTDPISLAWPHYFSSPFLRHFQEKTISKGKAYVLRNDTIALVFVFLHACFACLPPWDRRCLLWLLWLWLWLWRWRWWWCVSRCNRLHILQIKRHCYVVMPSSEGNRKQNMALSVLCCVVLCAGVVCSGLKGVLKVCLVWLKGGDSHFSCIFPMLAEPGE